jgi:hypothetical protein
VTITSLVPFGSAEEVIAAAADREPPAFMSTIVRDEAGIVFLYAGDVALESDPFDLDRPGRRRRLYAPSVKPWRWEDTGP